MVAILTEYIIVFTLFLITINICSSGVLDRVDPKLTLKRNKRYGSIGSGFGWYNPHDVYPHFASHQKPLPTRPFNQFAFVWGQDYHQDTYYDSYESDYPNSEEHNCDNKPHEQSRPHQYELNLHVAHQRPNELNGPSKHQRPTEHVPDKDQRPNEHDVPNKDQPPLINNVPNSYDQARPNQQDDQQDISNSGSDSGNNVGSIPDLGGPEEDTNNNERTTERTSILGRPVIVPTVSPDIIVFNNNSTDPGQTQCVQDCPSSSEYDPVCGTDNITYFNSGKFKCARSCGVHVFIQSQGRCPGAVSETGTRF